MSTLNATTSKCYHPPTVEPVPQVEFQFLIGSLYWATSFASIAGNALVIVVHCCGGGSNGGYGSYKKSLTHKKSFLFSITSSSATTPFRNIRNCLNSLAVSDITIALTSMPFSYANLVLGHWPYAHFLCPLAQYGQLLSAFVTSTTLTLISVERYFLTLHPLSRSASWLKTHNRRLLAAFWLVGALYAAVPAIYTSVTSFRVNGALYYQCTVFMNAGINNPRVWLNIFLFGNLVLTYLLPLMIMSAVYAAIVIKLRKGSGGRKRNKNIFSNGSGSNGHFIARQFTSPDSHRCAWIFVEKKNLNQEFCISTPYSLNQPTFVNFSYATQNSSISIDQRSRTVKMLIIVLLLYTICWSPVKLFQLLRHFRVIAFCSEGTFYLTLYSYIACHWLAMANSFVNPIVYSFMSRAFKNDFQKIKRRVKQAVCK